MVRATVEAVGDDATIVAGAGGSTKTGLELAEKYEAAGVDGVMILHPSHAYMHDNGLEEYYRRIAERTGLGIVLYKRSHEVGDGLITELSTIENVVGVKYAVNDIKAFSRPVDETPGDIVWINGLAERYAPSFALEGASGYTTGIGNFTPEPTLQLFAEIASENWERAKKFRDELRPLEDLREECSEGNEIPAANNVPAVKYGMGLLGYRAGGTREPLVEFSVEDKRRTRDYIEEITDGNTILAND